MAQRRFHYERAFEHYLRANGIPYIAVDEAKRAIDGKNLPVKLKNFDFVVYSKTKNNLLIDVKGRKHAARSGKQLDNWVTQADIQSITRWQQIFGPDFTSIFVFLYWCEKQPPDALFNEVFQYQKRFYTLKVITANDYAKHLKTRSQKWNTVHIPANIYANLAQPLATIL